MKRLLNILFTLLTGIAAAAASEPDSSVVERPGAVLETVTVEAQIVTTLPQSELSIDTTYMALVNALPTKHIPLSIYEMPYSLRGNSPDWHRMWINTAVLSSAFVTTLLVLECLPEDATAWNRAELRKDPAWKRWYLNVFKRGPEWDHDNPVFNFILHPYAGAAYFMSARSCGFNYYQSLLYAACISTVGWEYGIEACMERPSIQDLFITPLVGSLMGEGFYALKRHIVSHDYTLLGSRILGNIVVFLIDPVNEVVDLFRGSRTRKLHLGRKQPEITSSFMPTIGRGSFGFAFNCVF